MQNDISDIEKRVTRYWYTDGIGELIGGGMFLLLGSYFAVQEVLGRNSLLAGILQASLALLMIAGAFISRRLINALKTRLTYPRTGYVEYQVNENQVKWRRVWAFALAFVISAITLIFVRVIQIVDSVVAVTGVAVALILVFLRAKSAGVTRFYFLGGISLVLGVALSVSGLPNGYSLGSFYGFMGVCFLVSGGITLRGYLSENPMPQDGQDD